MIKSNIKQHVVPKSYLKRFGKKNLNNKGYNIAVKQLKSNKIWELYTSLHYQQHIVFMRISKKTISKRKSSFNNV